MGNKEYRIIIKQGNKEFEIGDDVEIYLKDNDKYEVINGRILHNTSNTFISILTELGEELILYWTVGKIRHIK